ncbi:DNA circularization protein [Pseudoxanthomonas sp. 22568]|uniref:DNA circularization protein n=1 Tax=Pseudoxanthomonas sp. 22568 TaxID=3453945 RepID=UPI003F855B27
MAWRDQLLPASFRGVPFEVLDERATFGRRTVLHEFPFRDVPFVEDLGRRARELQIRAIIVGSDYMERRDALIAAVEEAGSGKLVHPQYGEMQVSISYGVDIETSTAEGGCCRIQFSCVETGDARFPSAQAATADVVEERAEDAQETLRERFASIFDLSGLPAWASDDALLRAQDWLSEVRAVVAPIAQAIDRGDVLALVSSLNSGLAGKLRAPLAMAESVIGIVRSLRLALPARDATRALQTLGGFQAGQTFVPPTTPSTRAQARNRDTMLELMRGAAVAEAAVALSRTVFTDYNQAVTLRDAITDQIDAIAEVTQEDALYHALSDLRAAVVRDLDARGANLARVASYPMPATMPAVVLAWTLYQDSGRDLELAERNRIRHPGFVPGGVTLEVLVDG